MREEIEEVEETETEKTEKSPEPVKVFVRDFFRGFSGAMKILLVPLALLALAFSWLPGPHRRWLERL